MMELGLFAPNGRALFALDMLRDMNPEVNKKSMLDLARTAEEVGFDFMLTADKWAQDSPAAEEAGFVSPRYHAPLLAMAMFAVTERIRLVSTMHTELHHPTHVARIGATLHSFSGGRWGWNVVTSSPKNPEMFGRTGVPHTERYTVAAEFVELVKLLWSEEYVDFAGEHFQAAGRLAAPRIAPLVRPTLVAASASADGIAFAAEHIDMLMTSAPTVWQSRAARDLLDSHTPQFARAAEVPILPTGAVLVREGEGEAEELFEAMVATVNVEAARDTVEKMVASDHALGARYKDLPFIEQVKEITVGGIFAPLLGTPEQIAERMLELHTAGGAGGFSLTPVLWSPEEILRLRPVLDHLRDAGVWAPEMERTAVRV